MSDLPVGGEQEVTSDSVGNRLRQIVWLRNIYLINFVCGFITVVLLPICIVTYLELTDIINYNISVTCAILLFIELSLLLYLRSAMSNLAAIIVRDAQPHSIGTALDCLDLPIPKHSRVSLEEKILSLLSGLKDSEYQSLSNYQLQQIRGFITPEYVGRCDDVQLLFEALDEVSRLGDETDLAVMRRFAVVQDNKLAGRDVQKHAHKCAETLQNRLNASRDANRLLRPAAIDLDLLRPASANAALLRPASAGQEPPERLLRPMSNEDYQG